MRIPLTSAILSLAALPAGPSAWARTVDVFPGSGAPLQAAVDAAADGDVLRIHAGTYTEAVTVTKGLRLAAAGDGPVVVDAGCASQSALAADADRVALRGLQVRGGTQYEIDIEKRDRITVEDTVTTDSCGTAEYGINVFQSDHVRVAGNDASGFADSGIYLGGIAQGARARALGNDCHDSARGIIVEDSVASVKVKRNRATRNASAGIFLHNSDRITVARNIVTDNTGSGIELDSTSDDNEIVGNRLTGNGAEAVDHGNNNCWRGNTVNPGCG